MAKSLQDWVETDVKAVKNKPLDWLSNHYFFRDPARPIYTDRSFFFAPADGIIVYQKQVKPDDPIIDIKGENYTLCDALQDETFDEECLVIGIFMSMYDVHINRIPYSGTLCYDELEPIGSYNLPMLDVETDLISELKISNEKSEYLYKNQRMLNTIYSSKLGVHYYLLQIADYDVDCITPFQLAQNHQVSQNQRFSMIRYGSQVELIVPVSEKYKLELVQDTGVHVEAGLDPLIRVQQVNPDETAEEKTRKHKRRVV